MPSRCLGQLKSTLLRIDICYTSSARVVAFDVLYTTHVKKFRKLAKQVIHHFFHTCTDKGQI
jgi:hypothetical protein